MDYATRERLLMLMEEAAEVVQACSKALRHGMTNYHPNDPKHTPNWATIRRELDDVLAVSRFMEMGLDIPESSPADVQDAMRRKLRWAHHQGNFHIEPGGV